MGNMVKGNSMKSKIILLVLLLMAGSTVAANSSSNFTVSNQTIRNLQTNQTQIKANLTAVKSNVSILTGDVNTLLIITTELSNTSLMAHNGIVTLSITFNALNKTVQGITGNNMNLASMYNDLNLRIIGLQVNQSDYATKNSLLQQSASENASIKSGQQTFNTSVNTKLEAFNSILSQQGQQIINASAKATSSVSSISTYEVIAVIGAVAGVLALGISLNGMRKK